MQLHQVVFLKAIEFLHLILDTRVQGNKITYPLDEYAQDHCKIGCNEYPGCCLAGSLISFIFHFISAFMVFVVVVFMQPFMMVVIIIIAST
jgi:hypothetical protein